MERPKPTRVEKKMKDGDFIVSKTDTKGIITYGNEIFIQMSEYTEEELLGAPHSIIRHPDMPRVVFKLLWDTITQGNEIFAYVKNLAKSGSYYWVFTNVTASYDKSGKIIGYYSVRRKPNEAVIPTIEGLYKQMIEKEKEGGMEASGKFLMDFLDSQGVTYDEIINTLQRS
ncbi:MAG: PAS domain-containing protein [Nitrospinae bacterium]|nr:PAS domain-containing protein [Nitrospinota bacterium]